MITETTKSPDTGTSEETKAREAAFLSVLAESGSVEEAASFAGLYPSRYGLKSGRRGSLYAERGGEGS